MSPVEIQGLAIYHICDLQSLKKCTVLTSIAAIRAGIGPSGLIHRSLIKWACV